MRDTVVVSLITGRDPIMSLASIRRELRRQATKERAAALQRFFKTGTGEYGEGDIFLGLKVPDIRKTVKSHYLKLTLKEIRSFVRSKYHEERLFGLLALVYKYPKARDKDKIYRFYLRNKKYINNWDLIDLTAPRIVGAYLADKEKTPLYSLAESGSLWDRRISILATFYFIREGRFVEALKIAKILLKDKEDLIHKAVGWMLREIGKRDIEREKAFLNKYYRKMPRTMLRYSIERFPERTRQGYLKGEV